MLDIIRLSDEEYSNIIDMAKEIIKKRREYFFEIFKTDEISLQSFELFIGDRMLATYFFNPLDGFLTCYIGKAKENNKRMSFTSNDPTLCDDGGVEYHIKYKYANETQRMQWISNTHSIGFDPLSAGAEFSNVFWAVNFYLKDLPETVSIGKEKTTITYESNKKGDRRIKTKTILRRVIRIKAERYGKSQIRHITKCLCWGVRGHKRHLANGKTIWVKPYKKGKQRENESFYESKEYITQKEGKECNKAIEQLR